MDWMAIIPGLAVCVLGVGLSSWWFGLRMRKQLEASAGAQALSAMKPRECAGLVLEALSRQGYREESSSRQPGEGSGTEFLLRRGDDPVLMSYKHGSAYRLGDSNIREFANAIQLCGASHGLLVTLGSIEDVARRMARRYEIRLMDGRDVWPMVEGLAPGALQTSIREQASARTRTGLLVGCVASLVLGAGLVFLAIGDTLIGTEDAAPAPELATLLADKPSPAPQSSAGSAAAPTPAAPAQAPANVTAKPAPAVSTAQPITSSDSIAAANRAMEEIAKLSPADLAKRRADAATKISGIAQVLGASWSTQSTLILGLASSDGRDTALVTEACEMLARYEELRYTRLQLEPPAGTDYPVRWRMCQ